MKKKTIKYDKKVLCKCGKPAPIMPYYCPVCKRGSMGKLKLKVVKLGNKKLSSGIVIR